MYENLVIVIGRGHSGTRAIAKGLHASGVYMGSVFNGDPLDYVWEGCDIIKQINNMSKNSIYLGEYEWDFSKFVKDDIPVEFINSLEQYLEPIFKSENVLKGWKLPEFNLVYPYLVRIFPEAKFIHWVRHPLDNILKPHTTDKMKNIDFERKGMYFNRAISWKYQWNIVEKTPKPKNFLRLKLEDYVANPKSTEKKLTAFLGIPLKMPPTKKEVVGRWGESDLKLDHIIEFLKTELIFYEHSKLYL
jgi:hypothetical protein